MQWRHSLQRYPHASIRPIMCKYDLIHKPEVHNVSQHCQRRTKLHYGYVSCNMHKNLPKIGRVVQEIRSRTGQKVIVIAILRFQTEAGGDNLEIFWKVSNILTTHQDWLHGFPGLFTDISETICFYFLHSLFTLLVVGSVRLIKLTYVSFWAHVNIASRIVLYTSTGWLKIKYPTGEYAISPQPVVWF